MAFNPDIHKRKSNRLQDYDYAQPGAYFVTICAYKRECIFGNIVNGETHLNDIGIIVAEEWIKTAAMRQNVELDAWVVMPNHFHAIVMISDHPESTYNNQRNTTANVGAHCMRPNGSNRKNRAHSSAPLQREPRCIGSIMGGFKSAATKRINQWCKSPSTPVWQHNYYEHIIRNEADLHDIREYIQNNPLRWEEDSLYSGVRI